MLLQLQKKLSKEELKNFKIAISEYKNNSDYDQFIGFLNDIFLSKNDEAMRSLYKGLHFPVAIIISGKRQVERFFFLVDVPLFLKTEEHKRRFRRNLVEMGLGENNT